MVDLDWKAKIVSSNMPSKSPKLSNKLHVSVPGSFRAACQVQTDILAASDMSCSTYEHYLRLPELRQLWSSHDFPSWKNESVLKPALQALEITFRFVSTVLSDPRPYSNRREGKRRLESLTTSQIQLIAMLIEDDEEDSETRGMAPIVDLSTSNGELARDGSMAEVWSSGEHTVVSRISEASLLPRLATWHKSEGMAQKILYSIECEMRNCPYSLGLGEPNLAGKPNLDYDAVCKPSELHSLRKSPYDAHVDSYENQTVYATHQVLESWVHVCRELLKRVTSRIESRDFEKAASDCYMIERIWKLLAEIEDLHLLMDPADFLRLKNQLRIKTVDDTESFCFRSKALVEMTKLCKELRHKVPVILGVEVDPKGGPRIQEAAMRLYSEKKAGSDSDFGSENIHVLQALQAIESALKRFYYAYKQVLVVLMGSLEAKGNLVVVNPETCDSLSRIFLEPTYFPSLDAAKTFLGDSINHDIHGGDRRSRRTH
ncbi:nematode resistance protein-like HSPRO2 [Pyrus ussuriensis x Pyrus communis]|uniref:Nematode resistance protein-like HSPRO2 n=1 Tax=Pyrus ussuriensis x Pyrus communis TaxID=2448454 RepID=A0A5N5F265_9ROSA|nr:nematode resistance protein-like HSPRO2 [Pyrus ussuriensis x Pyrus communis]